MLLVKFLLRIQYRFSLILKYKESGQKITDLKKALATKSVDQSLVPWNRFIEVSNYR